MLRIRLKNKYFSSSVDRMLDDPNHCGLATGTLRFAQLKAVSRDLARSRLK